MNSTSPLSEDILATAGVIRQLGASVVYEPGTFRVEPAKETAVSPLFDCKESGSTLRFLLPVAAARTEHPGFTGSGRLPERPIGELLKALSENGVTPTAEKLPFFFEGNLKSGVFRLPGNISSQYITGLLLGLPGLSGDSEIRLTTALQSAAYIDITLHALGRFGIRVLPLPDGYHIPGGQTFHSPGTLTADGDWSNAAFFLAAGAIGQKEVSVSGLSPDSPQGDKAIVDLLKNSFGAGVKRSGPSENGTYTYTVSPAPLKGAVIDVTGIPDAFPILATIACFAEGPTTFVGGERLRLKESDRIASVRAMIDSLGGQCEETDDGLIVQGKDVTGGVTGGVAGGTVDACNDHRIAMAAAIAAMNAKSDVLLEGAEAVNKSYPSFYQELTRLGGIAHVI